MIKLVQVSEQSLANVSNGQSSATGDRRGSTALTLPHTEGSRSAGYSIPRLHAAVNAEKNENLSAKIEPKIRKL